MAARERPRPAGRQGRPRPLRPQGHGRRPAPRDDRASRTRLILENLEAARRPAGPRSGSGSRSSPASTTTTATSGARSTSSSRWGPIERVEPAALSCRRPGEGPPDRQRTGLPDLRGPRPRSALAAVAAAFRAAGLDVRIGG
ncbi:MAG: hypothetical protein M0C28_12705 [Candidatus Moduliflexus flocculans]|nr:hypothetical protein [Candidatus Moduliflexus flocculans]